MNDLITRDLIVMNLESSCKEDVIKAMAKLIGENDRLYDQEKYIEMVFEREKTFPTSLGFEVAIPHGKTDAVKIPTLAFAKLNNEIKWSEEENVKYVFLIAVPEKEAGDLHLQILAQISRKLMRDEFREALKNSSEKDELLKLLTA